MKKRETKALKPSEMGLHSKVRCEITLNLSCITSFNRFSDLIFSLHLYILYSETDNQRFTHVENS